MRKAVALTSVVLLITAFAAHAVTLRVKDLATLNDGGSHKLIGYGIVVGLQGTGDGKDAVFTIRSLANMLREFGVTVDAAELDVANVAAVICTAELPTHAVEGTKIDVTVSSVGDARSLQGGTLLVAPLRGADREVYAIAQGPVSIGGFSAGGGGANVSKNHAAVGRVPNGGAIVKSVADSVHGALAAHRHLSLQLHQPDYTTAQRIADTINRGLGSTQAHALTAATVQISIPGSCGNITELITQLENLPVQPDTAARVVVNERTGTVVIGSRVRILPVAIAHGSITVKAKRDYMVSQPPPLVYSPENTLAYIQDETPQNGAATTPAEDVVATPTASSDAPELSTAGVPPEGTSGADAVATEGIGTSTQANSTDAHRRPVVVPPGNLTGGSTVVVPDDNVEVEEATPRIMPVGGEATLEDLVEALNTLGVSPRDRIAIIQALKESGALQAELIIQ